MRTVLGLAALAALLVATPVRAQVLPGGAQLGMTPEQLQQAVPTLRAERARAPRGFTAAWSATGIDLAGVPLTASFAMADGQVQRIEYLAAPAAYDALLQWGRATFGPEMASNGPEGQYASWSNDALDAYLQRTDGSPVRLVVKRRILKDASEL
ncbi:hypothetical protein [Ramlibacter algicola]|uniref:Uncharacterized protein n=1 Tax=Ramlibacter algicola TaxID=2795217 RepID=A0A934Q5V3_9BURK|nr:hypothetical protein [Ramlibacter algicola]MBK0394829.1 hypothetical protein [Ramlibacter algicola]